MEKLKKIGLQRLEKTEITEEKSVEITVEYSNTSSTQETIKLAAKVYEGLSPADIDEVEQIALQRDNLFVTQSEI